MILDESVIHNIVNNTKSFLTSTLSEIIDKFLNVNERPHKEFNFDTLIIAKVLSIGNIIEMNLHCPCGETRIKAKYIIQYMEEGYQFQFDEKYVFDLFMLIMAYNERLAEHHAKGINLNLPFLEKSLENLVLRMRRNPNKYSALLKEANPKISPFIKPHYAREVRDGISSTDSLNILREQLIDRIEGEQVDWETKEMTNDYVQSFVKEFKKQNNIGKLGDVDLKEIKNLDKIDDKNLPSFDL